jgi:glycosyltransferase involved in cell wall biosynthesis
MTPLIHERANAAAKAGPGRYSLSVLIPAYRDDPIALLHALTADGMDHGLLNVEILLFDDGAPDAALNAAMGAAVDACARPARLLTAKTNLGRSAARNRLAARARGDWLLFLDADMQIAPGFLNAWLDAIRTTKAQALFGGYAPVKSPPRAHRLHATLAHASDVKAGTERAREGAFAVCSSNLAVAGAAFSKAPFDEGYSGWGWEDVDWALSFARHFTLGHIENPALHGGLETPDRLIEKFSRSGANFARLMARHPEYAARKGAQLALTLKRRRLIGPARIAGRIAALSPLPLKARVLGLKLYRAAIGAKALP